MSTVIDLDAHRQPVLTGITGLGHTQGYLIARAEESILTSGPTIMPRTDAQVRMAVRTAIQKIARDHGLLSYDPATRTGTALDPHLWTAERRKGFGAALVVGATEAVAALTRPSIRANSPQAILCHLSPPF